MDKVEVLGSAYQLLGFLQAVHNFAFDNLELDIKAFEKTYEYKAITKIIEYLKSN